MIKKFVVAIAIPALIVLSACDDSKNKSANTLTPVTYLVTSGVTDYADTPSNTALVPFEDPHTNLMGYKDQNGKIIINAQFVKALPFSTHGVADVYKGGHDWYKINSTGQILFKSYFFDNGPDYYAHDLVRFVDNNKIGFANMEGKIVIPANFDFAMHFSFSSPITLVCQGCKYNENNEITGGKWGIIDNHGNIIVPLEYERYDYSENNVSFFKGDDECQLYADKNSKSGYILSKPTYK
jgi:hypothetical protein